jgi:quinol monooxygenase YgiN
MNPIEIHCKLALEPGSMPCALDQARALVEAARPIQAEELPAVLRCDWFAHDAKQECIGMLAYRGDAALIAHRVAAAESFAALERTGTLEVRFLGQPSAEAFRHWAHLSPSVVEFDSGITGTPGAARYRDRSAAASKRHIEIYTTFAIRAGRVADFRRNAAAVLDIVKQKDPGTARYDWYYDDATGSCVALDTYSDPASMFAHMRNCHDAHEKLLHDSTMLTEFLGELPPEAMAAVAKYQPYVVRFVAGLQPFSAGGLG